MWPFKKSKKPRKPEHILGRERIEEFRAFRGIGEKFHYLGIEMTVTAHGSIDPWGVIPGLATHYVDQGGRVQKCTFNYNMLPALKAENPEGERS